MKLVVNDYEIKDVIRILRDWTELTQKDFAKSLNKSKRAIESWEYGISAMSITTFVEIAKKHGFLITIEKKTTNIR